MSESKNGTAARIAQNGDVVELAESSDDADGLLTNEQAERLRRALSKRLESDEDLIRLAAEFDE